MAGRRLESLDGFRGMAALCVLMEHLRLGFDGGFLSVDLFFVISGFVIALRHEQALAQGMGLKRFLLVRAKRLLPVYVVSMAAVIAITITLNGPSRQLLNDALTGLFLASASGWFQINPVIYSLRDEWVANIVYAGVLCFCRKRFVLLAIAFSWITEALFFRRAATWNVAVMPFSDLRAVGGFCAGVVIYRLWSGGKLEALPKIPPSILYVLWAALCFWRGPYLLQIATATIAAPLCVAMLARSGRAIHPLWKHLGAISYPLYASQWGVVIVLDALGFGPLERLLIGPPAAFILARLVLSAAGLFYATLSKRRTSPA